MTNRRVLHRPNARASRLVRLWRVGAPRARMPMRSPTTAVNPVSWKGSTSWTPLPRRDSFTLVSRRGQHRHRPLPRLTEPLVRDHHGTLRPTSWEAALERAAEGFQQTLDATDGAAIGLFSCSKSTNEMNFIAQKLARVALRTNNIDSCNRT